jgi:bifunctional enzyme CysN/CysC
VKSADTRWHDGALTPADRAAALGFRGATVWMTGLPASGKSTLAVEIEALLVGAGRPAFRLDGDNLRHGLNGDLGFSPEDRAENVRRTAHAAALLAEAGVVALVALVSPYAAPCTRPPACRSSRCSSRRRWPSASGATRRASTPARGRATCPG